MRIPAAIVALVLLSPSLAFAQQRGVGGDDPDVPTGVRRAVVVGVSKYPGFPRDKQLEYAAADARFFYQFLKSPAGGSVPDENLQALFDEQATSAKIVYALTWLRRNSKKGDEAIIYFAGHGDAEAESGQEGGFLLATDVVSTIYGANVGAINIDYLQKFVATMAENGASVLMVTDACRSGKLVGDPDGATRTTAALLQNWKHVAKIVSSAPDESSYEGKQWGGGHGAFTYFLIFGLQGLADQNNDGKVTLQELISYVNAHVPEETKRNGKPQNPQMQGSGKLVVARVDTAIRRAAQVAMDTRKPASDIPEPSLQVADARVEGKRGNASTGVDTALTITLASFNSLVAAGSLLEPSGASAWDAFQKLSKMPDAVLMLPELRNTLGTALQGAAQTVVFDYLAGGTSPPSADRLRRAARELTRALELFGADYELATPLRAQLRFLDGFAYVRANRARMAILPLKESIALDPKGAYAYNALGFAYLALDSIADARSAFNAAIHRAPRWVYPTYGLGLLDVREGRTAEAEGHFQQVLKDDAGSLETRRDLATLYVATKRPKDAERMLLDALRMDTSNVKTRADLGAFYQEQGRYADAIRVLERVIVLDPTTVEPYIRLSIAYFYSDHAEDAIRMAQRAIAVDAKSAWAYRVLGYYSKSLKRYAEAERAYRRGTELAPSWANLANDLGAVLMTLDRLPEAEAELRRAEKLANNADIQPDIQDNLGRLFEKKSQMDEAELSFRRALTLDSLNSYRHDVLAGFYYRQKRFTEAERPYRRAVELDPQSARLAGLLGSTYQKLGRPSEALMVYLKAVPLDSLNPERYNDVGVAAYEMATQGLPRASAAEQKKFRTSGYEGALAAFRRAAALEPTSALYAGNLGVTYKMLGRMTESEREYKRSIALDSLNSDRYTNLASLYVDLKRYRDAEAAYRRAAAIEPKSATIARSLGVTYRELNDTASAIREYLRALALDSLNYSRYTDVGIVYHWAGAGRYEDARIAFARAAQLAPQSAVNALNLGIVLTALKKFDEAEREYLRAIKLEPEYVAAHNTLARLYRTEGKLAEAEARYRISLKLQPNDPMTLNSIAWFVYGRGGDLTEAARLSDLSLADTSVSSIEDRRNYLDTRANVALDAGDPTKALSLWDRAMVGNDKPDPFMHFGRAMSLLELGRQSEAIAAYRQGIAADPKYGKREYLDKDLGYSAKAIARLERLKVLAQSGG